MNRQILTAITALALGCASAFAAKTADEVRIYINPGHGSWTGNDRAMQTIGRNAYNSANVDTTGFFESNTNLHKGFSLLDHLVEAGVPFDRTLNQTNDNPARLGAALDLSQHIVMSHVKCGPYPTTDTENANAYNRNLAEISEEVEANNFDYFISIHSNAASEGSETNYPLFLFRGQDDETYSVAGSKDMAKTMWPYAFNNKTQQWSYYSATNANIRGDVSFYGSGSESTRTNGNTYYGYLGVLKHGVQGFLVEGYFHTYQPSRQRAMNDDVCRHEGHLYARGLIDYLGYKAETTGEIIGIVRDLHEKFSNPLYHAAARSNDQYTPLNGVVVTLSKDGQVVKTYTTDNEYNGVFAFTDLEPGEYTLSYAAEGYKAATEEYLQPVTVTANETVYPMVFLESENYVPPTEVYENYPDALENAKQYGAADEYNLTKSEEVAPLAEQLAGKTIRRQIVRNGYLYVLALDADNEPYVYSVNLSDNTVAQISTEGLTLDDNKKLKLSDIAFTADNVLVGGSYGENQYSDSQIASGDVRGKFTAYKWANDDNGQPTGAPIAMFSSQTSCNMYNSLIGQSIAYTGTIAEGSLIATAETTGSSKAMRFPEFQITDGELTNTSYTQKTFGAASDFTAVKFGSDYNLIVSPLANDQMILDGSAANPTEWQVNPSNDAIVKGVIADELMANVENGATAFKYAGHSMLVSPVLTDGKSTGVKLLDITNGLANAKLITTNTTADAAEAAYVSAAGCVETTLDDNENVTAANLVLYLVRDGKITKYTTENTDQPVVRGEYAYNLSGEAGKEQTTFTFKSTGAVDGGYIILKNTETGEETKHAISSIAEGDNTFTFSNDDLGLGTYSWSVELDGKSIAQPTKVAELTGLPKARGIVIDNNPASKFFGNIYFANCTASDTYEKGIYILDNKLNLSEHAYGASSYSAAHTASPYRLGINENGIVFTSDWSDATSGIRTFNPANISDDYTAALPSFFDYTKRDSSGRLYNNDTFLCASTTAAHIYGTGENTKLYTFDEDDITVANSINVYNIGTATSSYSKGPDKNLGHVKMDNTNVELLANDNGLWVAQTRASGGNTTNVPSFVYIDNDGNILFNSGESLADSLNGSQGGGIAVTKDGKHFVVVDASYNYVVYGLEWNDKTPSLTYEYTVKTGLSGSLAVVNQIAVDYAGNLYILHQGGLRVWALPNDNNVVTTPATDTITVESDSSVDSIEAAEVVKVYPNPTTDVLNIRSTKAIEKIEVFNLSGAMVNASCNINGAQATINVSDLVAGIYFVRLNNGQAIRFIKK